MDAVRVEDSEDVESGGPYVPVITLCDEYLATHEIYRTKRQWTYRKPLTLGLVEGLDIDLLKETVSERLEMLANLSKDSKCDQEDAQIFSFDLKVLQFEIDKREGRVVKPALVRSSVAEIVRLGVEQEEMQTCITGCAQPAATSYEAQFEEIRVKQVPFVFEPFSVNGVSMYHGVHFPQEVPLTCRFWKGVGIMARQTQARVIYGFYHSAVNWYCDWLENGVVSLPDFVISNNHLRASFSCGYGEDHDQRYSCMGKCLSLSSFPMDPNLVDIAEIDRVRASVPSYALSHLYSCGTPTFAEDVGLDPPELESIEEGSCESFVPCDFDFVGATRVSSLDFFVKGSCLMVEPNRPYSESRIDYFGPTFFGGYSFEADGPRVLGISYTINPVKACSKNLVPITPEILSSYSLADQNLVYGLFCNLRISPVTPSSFGLEKIWPCFSPVSHSNNVSLRSISLYLDPGALS
jgi:hypothetical protein